MTFEFDELQLTEIMPKKMTPDFKVNLYEIHPKRNEICYIGKRLRNSS